MCYTKDKNKEVFFINFYLFQSISPHYDEFQYCHHLYNQSRHVLPNYSS